MNDKRIINGLKEIRWGLGFSVILFGLITLCSLFGSDDKTGKYVIACIWFIVSFSYNVVRDFIKGYEK